MRTSVNSARAFKDLVGSEEIAPGFPTRVRPLVPVCTYAPQYAPMALGHSSDPPPHPDRARSRGLYCNPRVGDLLREGEAPGTTGTSTNELVCASTGTSSIPIVGYFRCVASGPLLSLGVLGCAPSSTGESRFLGRRALMLTVRLRRAPRRLTVPGSIRERRTY